MKKIMTVLLLSSFCSATMASTYLGELEKGLPALTDIKSLCNSIAVAGGVDCVEAARALCEKQYRSTSYDDMIAILRGYNENSSELQYACVSVN